MLYIYILIENATTSSLKALFLRFFAQKIFACVLPFLFYLFSFLVKEQRKQTTKLDKSLACKHHLCLLKGSASNPEEETQSYDYPYFHLHAKHGL